MNLLAHTLGGFALLIWISSVQVKKKKNILLLQALANFLYAAQYYIFGLISTAMMNLISTIRSVIFAESAKKDKQPNIFILIIFLIAISIFGILYCKSFLDFLPMFATILYTISGWVKSNSILRYIYIVCAGIFLCYNFKVGAYVPMIGNIGEVISGSIALFRFKEIKK